MKNKKKQTRNNTIVIVIVLVAILALFGAGAYFYQNNSKKDEIPNEMLKTLVKDYSLVAGDKNAKVTVVEFMDPSCGTCIYFYPTVAGLSKNYDGKVKVVYRFLPFYNGSDFILSLVKAAADQGKFEKALELFLVEHSRWYKNHQVNPFVAWGILQEAGVDTEKAKKFIDENGEAIKGHFEQNHEDANLLGVTGTPTFYVNGKLLEKLDPNELINLVESEIKKVY